MPLQALQNQVFLLFQQPDNLIYKEDTDVRVPYQDGGFGTSFEKINNAIEEIYSDDGVVILMDLGSAVMTTEMVLEMMEDRNIKMIDCPIVEGAIAAAVVAAGNASMDEVIQVAIASRTTPKF